jgi:predicted nucleotidyltransferase
MQDFILAKREEIAELCRKHHVRRLSVFGSAARDDFDPETSDVDVIVEFEEIGSDIYLDNKTSLMESLRSLFGRSVDLLTWKSVKNRYILRAIERSHEPLYGA